MKEFVAHDVTSLRSASIRIILSLAAVMGFRLFTYDVTQAYLQSRENLTHGIYLCPKNNDMHLFDIKENQVLKLDKPLDGLCNSGDY